MTTTMTTSTTTTVTLLALAVLAGCVDEPEPELDPRAAARPTPKTLTIARAGTGGGTVTSAPAGIDCGADCTQAFTSGAKVTLTATPAPGASFAGWSGDPDCTDGKVTMKVDKTCIATFNVPIYNLAVTVRGSGTGTVTSSPPGISCGADCVEAYPMATVVALDATPAPGSTFVGWQGPCSGSGPCNVTMSGSESVTATFAVAYTTLAAAGEHTCGVTTGGGMRCWGQNEWGQLGDGTVTDRLQPVGVSGLGSGVTMITGGGVIVAPHHHSCAVVNGGAKCWGGNGYGQLGNGLLSIAWAPTSVIGLDSGVTAIDAGVGFTCAVVDGGAWCWGDDTYGQLGDGQADTYSPVPVPVDGLGAGVVGITAGTHHACAITDLGRVLCWGSNTAGQLGAGTTAGFAWTPQEVVGLSSGVVSVSAGTDHTCALLPDGSVTCWGDNSSGQLGDGTTSGTATPVASGMTNASAISAGGDHTCALSGAGVVHCWGANGWGALGNGTSTNATSPVPVLGDCAAVTAGDHHTCAVTSSGVAYCWGRNTFGQLGNGTQVTRTTPGPIW